MLRLHARVTAGMVLLVLPILALAHVTLQPRTAPSGSYVQATFLVPHGCAGSPTIALKIKIPEGVTAVKPQMKPGWTVSIRMRSLARPLVSESGRKLTETVDEVDWQGGSLPDDLYDTFGLMMKLPDATGRTLYFPAIQQCRNGLHRWIEIPAPGRTAGQLREPAPALTLTAAAP